ncbi:MAG: polyhydroxyalkanoate depolymerase [Alphaproteobacteria bacterium]
MMYQFHEFNNMFLTPANFFADAAHKVLSHPFSPMYYTDYGRAAAAGFEVMERLTRRFAKPEFGIDYIEQDGQVIRISEEVVNRRTFCRLLHFRRDFARKPKDIKTSEELPKVLIVAPMSGHYATLLRDTVRAMLQDHDVYITDWHNARDIPLCFGDFSLCKYIDYVIDFVNLLGEKVHVMAVCQPSVPVMAATAYMNAHKDVIEPASMILMGGPIDTRANPTEVNKQAKDKPIEWFQENVISTVPWYYGGAMRRVCPGFFMLSGFMSMNMERHIEAHMSFFDHLVEGDQESAASHRKFYDEFLAVMDIPAEFYIQSVQHVFQKHSLPRGKFTHNGEVVDLKAISKTALMTIEGERDDISGVGQTKAAHDICVNIPKSKQKYLLQKNVGHYGIFNGRRWREQIMPKVRDFIREV